MDASVFWQGLYAIRDLWHHDKPGLAWATGVALLLFWCTALLVGPPTLRAYALYVGAIGAVLIAVGLPTWVYYTPQRREQARRPDR